MEELILQMHDKTTLKNMALNKGLSKKGFNGRNVSRMRKQDFIDFIVFKDRNSPLNRLNNNEGLTSSLEDEVINLFQELIIEDLFQPLIRIINSSNEIDNIYVFGSRPDNNQDNTQDIHANKEPERIPNDEDESIPNFTTQELIKNNCSSDCNCTICEKNNDIKKHNSKVTTNLRDLETRITCVVCQINVRNTIFSPCNHLATCISCAKNSLLGKKCPLCRKMFDNVARIFY
jgi:hypothetical protein